MNMTKLKESPRKLPPFSLEGKYPTNFERALYQLKNAVYNRSNAMVLDGMQKIFISLIAAYTLVYVIRFILKRTYFSYKGFLFEDKRNPSFKTKLWAICHKLLSYTSPTLCTNDSLLPNLPVPKLSDTIARYLESVEGILSKVRLHDSSYTFTHIQQPISDTHY
ncbi:unnamed protein product [Anisakis simplex]|uniref:Carn_acyltransf domain-containing protein n=1 Tax=Anisakis simplex TaxID=6269 RepID=A0A0M3KGV9_ANISI|nr:unnamed protein product [Anisakis simplex]